MVDRDHHQPSSHALQKHFSQMGHEYTAWIFVLHSDFSNLKNSICSFMYPNLFSFFVFLRDLQLISSKVPKAEYVPTIIRRDDPSIIPILYVSRAQINETKEMCVFFSILLKCLFF